METAPIAYDYENGFFSEVYQDLPFGAVCLDARGKVLSANRKFQMYFFDVPDGASLCGTLRCTDGEGGCENCALRKAVRGLVSGDTKTGGVKLPTVRLRSRWFQVDGIPAEYFGARCAVLFFSDITDRVRKENAWKKKLRLDPQTGILNKHSLMRSLDSLARAGNHESFTLCMVDFDNFKQVNDDCGHVAGDRVLNAFAGIARKSIRPGDILGRYGGEEFLFLFPRTNPEQAAKIIGRIQSSLKRSVSGITGRPVTFSAGVLFCEKSDCARSGWELVEGADRLLYRAKRNGKDRVEIG